MTTRMAVVRNSDGVVMNVTMVESDWQVVGSPNYWVPPVGDSAKPCADGVSAGWTWDGSGFVSPVPPPYVPPNGVGGVEMLDLKVSGEQFLIEWERENRMRVLEGKPSVSKSEYREQLKRLLEV